MIILFIISVLWLLLIASWSLNPVLMPKIQLGFLNLPFWLIWYSDLTVRKAFGISKIERGHIACHEIAYKWSKLNHCGVKNFDMQAVAKFISLPIRPVRSFYFFAALVYPLLPLDMTGTKSESWARIYACFTYILNHHRIISRSEHFAKKYAEKLAHDLLLDQKHGLKILDERMRYIICAIMWELVFDEEPSELDLKTITELSQSISTAMTYNTDPDWTNRIHLCRSFMEQIRYHPKISILERDFKLTLQEMCTVVAMELFITPALEIGEIMSNLMSELAFDNTNLVQKISSDSEVMRYAVIATAHHYPALQALFRETSYVETDKDLTPCANWFHDTHVVEIQTHDIGESMQNKSIINDINHYISDRDDQKSLISEINTCMAFGKGSRICKGKELAIQIITAFLTTLYNELHQWPDVEISAGRKYAPFSSSHDRFYNVARRCLIADVHYNVDKLFGRLDLQRFQCKL